MAETVWMRPVLVPVKVKGYSPGAAPAEATNVKFVGPPGVAGLGENVALVPEGKPLTDIVTGSEKPARGLMVTVKTPLPPAGMTCVKGETLKVKSGSAVTCNATGWEWVMPSAVAPAVHVYSHTALSRVTYSRLLPSFRPSPTAAWVTAPPSDPTVVCVQPEPV